MLQSSTPAAGLGRSASLALLGAALGLLALAVAGAWKQAPNPDPASTARPAVSLAWWLHPLERNAAKRVVIQAHLDGLQVMAGGESLWVVGSGGMILHSADGGVQWEQRHAASAPAGGAVKAARMSWISEAQAGIALTPPKQEFQQNLPFDPRQQQAPPSKAVDEQPAPSNAVDKQPPPSNALNAQVPLKKSRPAAPSTGAASAAAAASAPLAASAPSAPRREVDPLTADLHAIAFFDKRRGWAVGDGGTVLATRDGGVEWQPQKTPVEVDLRAIDFVGYEASGSRLGRIFDGLRPVLESTDQGNTWRRAYDSAAQPAAPTPANASANQRLWSVDARGQIRSRANVGSAASTLHFDAGTPLHAIAFADDAKRGWAVGDNGTIVATRDGGQTWFRQSAGITAAQPGRYASYPAPWTWLSAVASLALMAVVLLRGFRPEAPTDTPSPSSAEVVPSLGSDQPLDDVKDDRLGYAGSVLALSDFLRNAGTDPKLTLAITAPWGMGKSSMMGMLRGELRHWGFRTAWFNAWHHQQEGRPLSALFNTIRQQAVPSIWREPFAAIRVRSRLLWARGWAYRLGLLLVGLPLLVLIAADLDKGRRQSELSLDELLAWNFVHHWLKEPHVAITPASLSRLHTSQAAAPATDPCTDDSQSLALRRDLRVRPAVYCYIRQALVLQGDGSHHVCNDKRANAAPPCVFSSRDALVDTIDESLFGPHSPHRVLPSERAAIDAAAEVLPPPPLLPTVEHLLPLLALLGLLLTKGFAVYGLEVLKPLKGLIAKSEKSDDSGAEPSGTIERYRREFCLLTTALDGRLVVFVDDLDRCDKATVNSLLEMSNYLIDHGRCFIVIGAAMEQVKAAIQVPEGYDPAAYRNEYLRKLVHIELPVPQPDEAGFSRLINGPEKLAAAQAAQAAGRLHEWAVGAGALAQRHLGWVLAAAAGIAIAGAIADLVRKPDTVEPIATLALQPVRVADAASAPSAASSPATPSASQRTPLPGPAALRVQPPTQTWLAWFGGGSLLLLSGLWGTRRSRPAWQSLAVALGGAVRTQDSDNFRQALALWRRAVRSYDATPRGLKRFCNRARLFAIVARDGAAEHPTPEHHVVALTALHHVSPELVQKLTAALDKQGSVEAQAWSSSHWSALERLFVPEGAALRSAWDLLLDCLKEHARLFSSLPTADDVRRFNALLGRISVR